VRFWPGPTELSAAVLVTPRSADVTTGVVTVAECGLDESVGLETLAVLTMFEPLAALGLTCTTTVNTAEAPAARVAVVPVIVPAPPTDGLVKEKAGPLVWLSETKVVLLGTASVSCTLWASEGPLLVRVTV
jgi:hypothetical protein